MITPSMTNPSSSNVGQRSLATAANLANLLPTGTVLAAQALLPTFTQNGNCTVANKCLTLSLIICCSIACFFSSFTDSFIGKDGKLYYGIATRKGLYIFNDVDRKDGVGNEELDEDKKKDYKISFIDFVHAFASLIVFLVFSLSSADLQDCFFTTKGANEKQLIINLPLGAGILASFLFMLFPTKRRGIGYADTALSSNKNEASPSSDQANKKEASPPSDQKPERELSMVSVPRPSV